MPVLQPEVCYYPQTLFELDGAWEAPPPERRWWALYTKARQEKAVSRALLARQIPFYLPLIEKKSLCRGRTITTRTPLFANYVFICGDAEQRIESLQTNRVCLTLPVHDPRCFCRDLRQVRRLIESKAPLTPESRLQPGQRVRVEKGSLAGLEGVVLRRRGETRLVIRVDFLQQGASIAIDDYLLAPV